MRLFAEPSVEVNNRLHALREHRKIAGVDQDVAVRHLNLTMKLMGIAEKDKPQRGT